MKKLICCSGLSGLNSGVFPARRFSIFFIIYGFIIFVGCRTILPVPHTERTFYGTEVYEEIRNASPRFSTYSAGRLSIRVVDNKDEFNFRGSVRIRKDSALMVSINAFAGIEAARILFTMDSVKIIDRLNNAYFIGNYDNARRFYPFLPDYPLVQSLFTGSPLTFFERTGYTFSDRNVYSFDEGRMTLLIEDFPGRQMDYWYNDNERYRILLDPGFRTDKIEYSGGDNVYGSIDFISYGAHGDDILPEEVDFYFISHNLPFTASIRIGRIETGREISFPFSVPERYRSLN